MTMDPQHPLDERLAAYADRDADVLTDGTLRAHVTSCERCALVVRDLGALRSALADLPDLVPSRPLRFLPPVEPAAAHTERLRGARLAASSRRPSWRRRAGGRRQRGDGRADGDGAALRQGRRCGGGLGHVERLEHRGGHRWPGVPPANAYGPGSSPRAGGDSGVPVPQAGGGSTVPLAGGASGREDSGATPAAPMPWLAFTIVGAAIVIATLILRWTGLPAAGTRSPPF